MFEEKPLRQRVAEDLRERILIQDLAPGQDLDEAQLCEHYELSRPPLREVLSQLRGEGYVVQRPRRGVQVAPLSHTALRDFFAVAPMIYAAVAQLAAQHRTEEQLTHLQFAQDVFRDAIDKGHAPLRAISNQHFHRLMGEMAHNAYLMPSLQRLLIDHTRIGISFFDPENKSLSDQQQQAIGQHDALIELLRDRDAEGAAAMAIAHWELSRAEIENFATPAGLSFQLDGVSPPRKERSDAI